VINGDTNHSSGTTVGPFVQATWKVNERLNVITGARYDRLHADVMDPVGPFYDEDSISVSNTNYNVSLVFKPTPTSAVYATYNKSENISGAVGNGGGITGWGTDADGNTILDPENFKQPAELKEAGAKFALLENKLFMSFAYFDQTRTSKQTSSVAILEFTSRGFEAELNYQPNKNFYGTLSFSYIDATTFATNGPGDYPFGGPSELVCNEAQLPATAVERRTSGLPRASANALISYSFDNGWGFSTNVQVTGPINNNIAGTLVIPTQYELDGSVWYKRGDWTYRVSVGNITNEKNWAPPNSVYGNGSIFALAGTTVSFNAKYRF
jgi:outer membrane receptor protein involved in Fe transport